MIGIALFHLVNFDRSFDYDYLDWYRITAEIKI